MQDSRAPSSAAGATYSDNAIEPAAFRVRWDVNGSRVLHIPGRTSAVDVAAKLGHLFYGRNADASIWDGTTPNCRSVSSQRHRTRVPNARLAG